MNAQEELPVEKENKILNHLALNINMGGSPEQGYAGGFGIRYSILKKQNNYYNFGGGLGLEIYNLEEIFLPIYGEATGNLTKWKNSPFYRLNVGVGFWMPFDWRRYDNKPLGAFVNPMLGWRFQKRPNFATTVALGYQMQHVVYKYDYSWDGYIDINREIMFFQRYNFQLGFEF